MIVVLILVSLLPVHLSLSLIQFKPLVPGSFSAGPVSKHPPYFSLFPKIIWLLWFVILWHFHHNRQFLYLSFGNCFHCIRLEVWMNITCFFLCFCSRVPYPKTVQPVWRLPGDPVPGPVPHALVAFAPSMRNSRSRLWGRFFKLLPEFLIELFSIPFILSLNLLPLSWEMLRVLRRDILNVWPFYLLTHFFTESLSLLSEKEGLYSLALKPNLPIVLVLYSNKNYSCLCDITLWVIYRQSSYLCLWYIVRNVWEGCCNISLSPIGQDDEHVCSVN